MNAVEQKQNTKITKMQQIKKNNSTQLLKQKATKNNQKKKNST